MAIRKPLDLPPAVARAFVEAMDFADIVWWRPLLLKGVRIGRPVIH